MTRLFRSRKKIIGGVCQGLADYLSMDGSIMRILFILGTVCTIFPFVLFYILCWIFIPLED